MNNLDKIKIKVCGMGSLQNMQNIDQLGVDYLGFIIHEASPRHLKDTQLLRVPTKAEKVLITKNMQQERLSFLAKKHAIKWLQLHGNESVKTCTHYKNQGFQLIKTISISTEDDFQTATSYREVVDFLLFDTASKLGGGSGIPFNWQWLKHYISTTGFFLSGGISVEDASIIREIGHPGMVGIDLNSRFEIKPGLKNISTLKKFIHDIKEQ
ncbi:MAG: phosphoribosylanthranilate isomerase [Bacteroidetes bacterium]|jgi:phosphoribosylanthranilate isomerase|nr:phosphoribosylanthranilate isomerase [Bacteroidota bacterium]